CARGGYYYDYW
nr:immunoglobulin heavy chain junction region [Mus musculus]MBK4195291.1 immunoglobulin heavy chain junction region [Mus musculus]MBK4198720.1 immunoglobulin heavy chain junction region [Mus musculus]